MYIALMVFWNTKLKKKFIEKGIIIFIRVH